MEDDSCSRTKSSTRYVPVVFDKESQIERSLGGLGVECSSRCLRSTQMLACISVIIAWPSSIDMICLIGKHLRENWRLQTAIAVRHEGVPPLWIQSRLPACSKMRTCLEPWHFYLPLRRWRKFYGRHAWRVSLGLCVWGFQWLCVWQSLVC